MELKYVGPLLCARITMFNPLNKHVLKKGGTSKKSVGIVGFGGLGSMGAKLAKARGCDVTFLFRSLTSKKDEATKLGADILAHSDEDAFSAASGKFVVIIDHTVAVHHEIQKIMPTLKIGGTYYLIGAVGQPSSVVHARDANAQFKALTDGSADTARAVIEMSMLSVS
jgi:uncharacterized zinc-type alcohol dehydrogenase-like protein